MAIFELFSKRQKKLRGDVPDVYAYDKLPDPLRVQIVHIWRDGLGDPNEYQDTYNDSARRAYKFVVETLCREYGLFKLPGSSDYGTRNYLDELVAFFLQIQELDKALDAIEVSFRVIDVITRDYNYLRRHNAEQIADASIGELNARFKEHGVGFQFVERQLIRVDAEFIHSEVVKPALSLLHEKHFAGAREEFLKAHEHYRASNHKEALAECLKAFESVMKAICKKRKWSIDPNWTSKQLIQVCLDNQLVPAFWQQHFSALRAGLESSIPTGRNKLGAHGQGDEVVTVPPYLVAYMLHMTASTIVFLTEADRAMR